MTSKTSIANRALSKLGEPRVSNVDTTDTKPARVLKEMFDNVRDAVLASSPWKFALKRAILAKEVTGPAFTFDYKYRYTKPTDYLGMYEVLDSQGDNPDYDIEGDYILTNTDSILYIRYIYRIADYSKYPAVFIEALAARLAYEACEEITQSNTKKEVALKDYDLAVTEGWRINAIERPKQDLPEDSWIQARQ